MDAQLKAKWVEALRSGKYKQADARLRDPRDGSFCCLGVLAELQGCSNDRLDNVSKSGTPEGYDAGLTFEEMHKLADMNDGRGGFYDETLASKGKRSFPEIANYIEANIPADSAVKDADSA